MAWKQSGHPTVQQQRDKWVVRVDGLDTETGRRRPRQIGTYSSKRSATRPASAFSAAGDSPAQRETVGHLVDEWVAGKVDVSNKTRLQYEWAAGHIRAGIGGVRVDQLERQDVARWLDQLAADGKFSRRSIQIMRMVHARSRRTIPIDASTVAGLKEHRRFQNEERLAAGPHWSDDDLVVATRTGRPVSPGNFDQSLERLVRSAGVPRLTSHGLRHTAATHMVRHAADIGEIRAAADILGHSPDMLMRTYAHALPESVKTVTDKIGARAGPVA